MIDATDPVFEPPARLRKLARLDALNKADLARDMAQVAQDSALEARDLVRVSAKTGEGLDTLIARLETIASEAVAPPSGQAVLTRTRHRVELVSARDALQRFVNHDLAPELKAEELRIAARHLGRLTGLIDVEEVLGAIFAEFCIGK